MRISAFAVAGALALVSMQALAAPIGIDAKKTNEANAALRVCASASCGLGLAGFPVDALATESMDFQSARLIGELVVSQDGSFSARQISRYSKYCSAHAANAYSRSRSCFQQAQPTAAVPEPGSLLLLGTGLMLLAMRRRRG